MDRRTLLKFIASLPFMAFLAPKESDALDIKTTTIRASSRKLRAKWSAEQEPVGVYFDLSPQEMGEKLVANLRAYRAECEKRVPDRCESEEHWRILEALAMRIAFGLHYEQENLSRSSASAQSGPQPAFTSLSYFEGQDPYLLKKVRFGVMDSPVAVANHPETGELVSLVAQSRKVRAVWSPEAVDDLRAFHGIDAEFEFLTAMADEIVLEIARECRNQFKEKGTVPAMYAIYMPPTMSPSYLDPKDFSIHRSLRMRYAKVL